MNSQLKPPLNILIVGRPQSKDWAMAALSDLKEGMFFEDLYRCLSYDITDPQACNPSIPVYFSIGDVDPQRVVPPPKRIAPAPLSPQMFDARCILVLVLIDPDEFRSCTEEWTRFFATLSVAAADAQADLRVVAMSRDKFEPRDLKRIGLEGAQTVYPQKSRELTEGVSQARRFFRIRAMIEAIKALGVCSAESGAISIFVSYAKCDFESGAEELANALGELRGVKGVVDLKAFSPAETEALVELLQTSHCVIACRSNHFANRDWCQYEAMMAKQHDIPMIVLEMSDSDERGLSPALNNCPVMRLGRKLDGRIAEVVEFALSEIVRVAHHRARCHALMAWTGIDADRVCVLGRDPEPLSILQLHCENDEAVRNGRMPRKLVFHPDPPLREFERLLFTRIDPEFQFLTPSTLFLASSGMLSR